MIGTHPKTGKPIRIIQTETSIHRDAKTIVWFDSSVEDKKWCRYDIGAVGSKHFTEITDVLVLCNPEETDQDAKWIVNGNAEKAKIIFASKAVLDAIGLDTMKQLGIGRSS
jgi:hypothetical protein